MDKVLNFANDELNRYFRLATGRKSEITLFVDRSASDAFDEHFIIDVERTKGRIMGCNVRSVLLGVYRFLRILGLRFVYPGKDGEYIPEVDADNISVHEDFRPANRHRGITLEGCCSEEHVVNLIDWAAKNGFNSYFIQFRTGYTFFEKWYKHIFDPFTEEEPFDDEKAKSINVRLRREISKRGMIFHSVGHGWTCEPYGIPSRGWDVCPDEPGKFTEDFALVNGKRGFYKGIPLNTNLCYSKTSVRKKVIDNVVEYLDENPGVDVLHLWLADNYNNYCECPDCAKKTPSDWYVVLLNELDRRLTDLGKTVKIVFLIYFELLYAPREERIANPDRFIMMFAPITRKYDVSLGNYVGKAHAHDDPPALTVNKFIPPVDCAENLAFLFDWQKSFSGDSFIFDYPLMWDVCRDYGGVMLAKTIYSDIRALSSFGLNGYVSCQLQRIFFPTGFALYVLGTALFDGKISYEEIKDDFFRVAFGKNSEEIYDILVDVSSSAVYNYMRGDEPDPVALHASAVGNVARYARYTGQVAKMMVREGDKFRMRNLFLVSFMLKFASLASQIVAEKTGRNNKNKIELLLRELQIAAFSVEPGCSQRFDAAYYYTHVEEMANRQTAVPEAIKVKE